MRFVRRSPEETKPRAELENGAAQDQTIASSSNEATQKAELEKGAAQDQPIAARSNEATQRAKAYSRGNEFRYSEIFVVFRRKSLIFCFVCHFYSTLFIKEGKRSIAKSYMKINFIK
jgi:hypothetical protein